ncbi:hypothetical protein [Bacillus cereus]|uniref:hypothetical protein n=1 Tax=Bacillus cereus TaxID=1396 RepID=UPI0009769E3E|nr:hypothetical protein [Bacillus cereus]ONH02178.1 hypothetical protein BKK45_01115 [Bacillus cereus]
MKKIQFNDPEESIAHRMEEYEEGTYSEADEVFEITNETVVQFDNNIISIRKIFSEEEMNSFNIIHLYPYEEHELEAVSQISRKIIDYIKQFTHEKDLVCFYNVENNYIGVEKKKKYNVQFSDPSESKFTYY